MLPSPTLSLPTLSLYQLSYQGLAFGGIENAHPYDTANPYQLQPNGTTGLFDAAVIASGDTQRPLDQGEFQGLDVYQGRDITLVQSVTTDAVSFDHARQALGGALAVQGATEQPLFIQLASGLYACMARPRKHACPFDNAFAQVQVAIATSLLHATDPRWYRQPTLTASTGPAMPGSAGGLTFPASAPFTFGSGGTGGVLDIANAGTIEMRPVLVVTGPVASGPITIANTSITGSPQVSFDVALNAGDTLTIDMDWQTAVLVTAGSTQGSSRANDLRSGSTWWNLPADTTSRLLYTTGDVAAASTLTVWYTDALSAL